MPATSMAGSAWTSQAGLSGPKSPGSPGGEVYSGPGIGGFDPRVVRSPDWRRRRAASVT